VLMSTRVVLPHCFVLWIALGVGVAQRNPVIRSTQFQNVSEASRAKAVELNRQGSESVAAKQLEQAKALFKQAIQLDPKLSDAYENLALILLLDGNDVAAEHTAIELLALAPENYNARLVAGVAALNRNNFSRGGDYLFPLIRNDADDPLLITAYEIALEGRGQNAEAARFSAKSARLPVKASDALLAGQIFRQPKLKAIAQKWMENSVADAGASVNPELLY
jgi:tetratricopeptide (TPR) repeat protein